MSHHHPAARNHELAMASADRALLCRRQGDPAAAQSHSRQAAEHELAAAQCLQPQPRHLGISVLLRSAATMALDAGDPQWARAIITQAQANEPHPDIAPELDDLLTHIAAAEAGQFRQHEPHNVPVPDPADRSNPPDALVHPPNRQPQ